MNGRRIAVTGLGLLTSVGTDVASAWDAICNGKSGITPITRFDVSEFSTRFGGSLQDFDRDKYIAPKEARRMDEFMHYGIAAGVQALEDSGLEESGFDPERFGVAVGSGIGGITTIEETALQIHESGPRKVTPFFVPGSIINMISGNLSIRFNLKGPNISVVTACTTGTHNIGLAANMISNSQADIMLVGGAEMATSRVGLGGFCAARALSTRNDDPERASRPWDKDRDGFVLSDGAGVMVLEEMEHAQKRGATIYAELVGFGMSGDAYHMTAPSEGGEGAARCMRNALHSAQLDPSEIDYINAHGTSTLAGDVAESQAVKTVFGDHAHKLCVSSTKSMIGHLLGASGAAEAIVSVLTLRDQIVSPTINLDNTEEGCDLDYVPHTAREQQVNAVLSNSFGFGGTNGSLIFKRV
ncbi:MAG: beta-ketoacyl-[acyl-carrier-protein] synthase II [Gammaproteobacteria bacterium]|nr:beta-ketoacyl-[acyl-carrier-protein] synthase II [Gammaproteobacteria bacterium]HBJ90906.1 beta-ketoacyl-[acyl-carrier-protein] synthase II [Gammaproteobacteria bacterium]HCA36123.1 beta-ketoacyl-[acyl-carrier-protein] synthase II [Gammaproteobacteria bacterium]HCL71748.1 beta-ketoacyl-[acyl-carrier-protein] synthase II [Gammaproteobacteria bacterium]